MIDLKFRTYIFNMPRLQSLSEISTSEMRHAIYPSFLLSGWEARSRSLVQRTNGVLAKTIAAIVEYRETKSESSAKIIKSYQNPYYLIDEIQEAQNTADEPIVKAKVPYSLFHALTGS